ncbi:MAG: TM2 domain-containing protein [Acidimicrobiia bacterium]|nr:TM2 domain-containing protein [Acidimicrobiia bacterium]MCY4458721.1 TM2 domain-containing protein [Acidimicrobiaceae bacterium]
MKDQILARQQIQNPGFILMLTLLVPVCGAQYFVTGQHGKGVLHFFTLGGLGIWWFVSLFTLKHNIATYNQKIVEAAERLETHRK